MVGDEHELGVGAATVLPYGFNRYAMLGEDISDCGEYPNDISNLERDVIARQNAADLAQWARRITGLTRADRPTQPVARNRDEIAQHGTRGWRAAGARAVEHEPSGRHR